MINTKEFAEIVGVTQVTVRNWVQEGLPAKVGYRGKKKVYLINADAGKAWLQHQRRG